MNHLLKNDGNIKDDRIKITRISRAPFSDLSINSTTKKIDTTKNPNHQKTVNTDREIDADFMDARQYFTELDSKEAKPTVDVIATNFPIVRRSSVKNLNKKLESSHKHLELLVCFNKTLNDKIYIKDDYENMLEMEIKYAIRLTEMINQKQRISVINWLIRVQQFLNLSEITLHLGVRLFDRILCEDNVHLNDYKLTAIVCLWISSKIVDQNTISVSKIHAVCSSTYTRQEIIANELNVLQSIEFDLYHIEPLTILYYYLIFLNLQHDKLLFTYGQFLLEFSLIFVEYSSFYPTIIAATVLHLVLKRFNIDPENFVQFIDEHLFGRDEFIHLTNKFERRFNFLKNTKLVQEIIAKYKRDDYLNVANYL